MGQVSNLKNYAVQLLTGIAVKKSNNIFATLKSLAPIRVHLSSHLAQMGKLALEVLYIPYIHNFLREAVVY